MGQPKPAKTSGQRNFKDKLTSEQLDCIAEHLIRKALGDNPAAVAEATRRIDAGETVTVEAVCQDVTEPTGATLEPRKAKSDDNARRAGMVPALWHDQPSCEMG